MKRLLPLLGFMLAVNSALAYPITPQTLRKLILHSQYIVIATIDDPQKAVGFEVVQNDTLQVFSYDGDGRSDLKIREVLKGSLTKSVITVAYEAGMVCPAPPYYPDKKTVIAFLGKDDTAKTYYTYGLSYGSKVVETEAELALFRQRIVEYLAILQLPKGKLKTATTEWLVKCAENKCTRWEGADQLSREGFFMSFYDQSKSERFDKALTKQQRQRLDSVFFATDTLDYSDMCLANLVEKKHYPELKEHLLKSLPLADKYLAQDMMRKIIELSGKSADLQAILDFSENLEDGNEQEQDDMQKLLVKRFITEARRL